MTPTVYETKRGILMLTAADGELWAVFKPGEPGELLRHSPFALPADVDRLVFYSENGGLRAFAPAPVGWRDLGAEELAQLLQVAVRVLE